MRTAFSRMKPSSDKMVTEPGLTTNNGRPTTALLCVECEWEGAAVLPEAPWPVFQQHPCRLITESVSTRD